jgi:hypothetical protein
MMAWPASSVAETVVLAQRNHLNPQAVGGSLGWSALTSVVPLAVVLVTIAFTWASANTVQHRLEAPGSQAA